MSIPILKRFAAVLGVFCVGLLGGGSYLFLSYGRLHIRAAFADEQTQIFDAVRTQALQSTSPSEIAGSLAYGVDYYPSGSKQRAGSELDRVVERHRTAMKRDIIDHLRRTTGQDLGDRPEPWIQKYVRR